MRFHQHSRFERLSLFTPNLVVDGVVETAPVATASLPLHPCPCCSDTISGGLDEWCTHAVNSFFRDYLEPETEPLWYRRIAQLLNEEVLKYHDTLLPTLSSHPFDSQAIQFLRSQFSSSESPFVDYQDIPHNECHFHLIKCLFAQAITTRQLRLILLSLQEAIKHAHSLLMSPTTTQSQPQTHPPVQPQHTSPIRSKPHPCPPITRKRRRSSSSYAPSTTSPSTPPTVRRRLSLTIASPSCSVPDPVFASSLVACILNPCSAAPNLDADMQLCTSPTKSLSNVKPVPPPCSRSPFPLLSSGPGSVSAPGSASVSVFASAVISYSRPDSRSYATAAAVSPVKTASNSTYTTCTRYTIRIITPIQPQTALTKHTIRIITPSPTTPTTTPPPQSRPICVPNPASSTIASYSALPPVPSSSSPFAAACVFLCCALSLLCPVAASSVCALPSMPSALANAVA
jgi:hypothetical protein